MKKFLLVTVASFAVACGGKDNEPKTPKLEKCTAAQEGDQKCSEDNTQRLECDGSVFAVLDTCNAPTVCTQPGAAARVVCSAPVAKAGEFEACTGTGQGNCEDGLTCFSGVNAQGDTISACVTQCDASNPASCGAGRTCEQITVSLAVCFGVAGRDELCLIDEQQSLCEEGLECAPDVLGIPACKLTCSGEALGTQGSCGDGELCLGIDLAELQPDQSFPNGIPCTNVGEVDICDDTYTCLTVGFSDGSSADVCARETAWCGQPAPILSDLSEAGLNAFDPTTDGCGFAINVTETSATPGAGAALLCPELGDADVVCSELPMGIATTACTRDADCNQVSGESCIDFVGGAKCGFLFHGCLAFCEEAADCGSGYSCEDPGTAVDFVPQRDGNDFVECEGEDGEGDDSLCDEENGNYCNEFQDGFFCIRNARICVPE